MLSKLENAAGLPKLVIIGLGIQNLVAHLERVSADVLAEVVAETKGSAGWTATGR